ncbi:MAG TPA: hypothetical protein VHP38_03925 [Ruminiclostridium sp.]|nr:hypothetical protein [Ruminiclostridium sp.]
MSVGMIKFTGNKNFVNKPLKAVIVYYSRSGAEDSELLSGNQINNKKTGGKVEKE